MHSSQSGLTAARSASKPADAPRCFVHDERVAALGQPADLGLAGGRTPGQETGVGEAVDGEPRRAQHREQRRRPGHRAHRETRVDRAVDHDVPGIAEQRRSRVAHERDARAALELREHLARALGLVVIVIAEHPTVDVASPSAAPDRGSGACPPRARGRPLRAPAGRAATGRRRCRSGPTRRRARRAGRRVPSSRIVTSQLGVARRPARRTSARSISAALFVASYANVRPRKPGPRRNTSASSPRKNALIVAVNVSRTPRAVEHDLDVAAQAPKLAVVVLAAHAEHARGPGASRRCRA